MRNITMHVYTKNKKFNIYTSIYTLHDKFMTKNYVCKSWNNRFIIGNDFNAIIFI